MAVSATLTYDKDTDSYDCKFEFHKFGNDFNTLQGILGIIKASVPVSNRHYDSDTKHWSFLSVSFKKIVEPLFVTMKVSYRILEQQESSKTVSPENFFYEHAVNQRIPESPATLGAQLVKLLEITEDILKDTNALKKAYRRKALEFHPDRNGGDGSRMSNLNEVWNAYNRI